MFDAINGDRCIGDIEAVTNSQHDTVRSFFERLWQFDQVVFDASRLNGSGDALYGMVKTV